MNYCDTFGKLDEIVEEHGTQRSMI